ncbi:MAG TPA: glycoside hydrolase family 172 protein [Allosphingosinicella sp.]|jgi:hypothetical protein|nr:glycoside hydrolase family 172 protein [Allosphingosinicella sp.]
MRGIRGLVAAAAVLAAAVAAATEAQPAPAGPVEALYRLDLLPRLRDGVSVGAVTSFDRTGGNDDGFNGTYSFVRREAGGLVIADLQGPGVVTRIWTPTPSEDPVEFYFDGERRPRLTLPMRALFDGSYAPFLAPLAVRGAGGFTSYAPIAYRHSLKIVVRSQRVEFYQVNFARLPGGARVASGADAAAAGAARAWLGAAAGSDLSAVAAGAGAPVERHGFAGRLEPGGRLTLFEAQRGGRIVGLRLGPAATLAGGGRDLRLRVFYDGASEAAIDVPAGDLFGYAWGQPAMRGVIAGTDGDTDYLYLPMPFDRAVRIELVSERTGAAVEVAGEAMFAPVPLRADEGRLYALWRRENPTEAGRPYTFLDVAGRGQLVGVILQAQGPEPGAVPEFFEGDDETWIEGQSAVHGTGSEDFFNGGWYDVPGRWDGRVSLPLSGSLGFQRHLARTGGYRFMIADAYPYRASLRQTIEHGPEGNRIATDYASIALFYSAETPRIDLAAPPLPRRAVADPERVVFTPGWTTPIHAFSWSNATLAKEDVQVDGRQIRHLSLDAQGREVFGPHYVSFLCEMPAAGRYRVRIQAISGPDQGIVQLFRDEVARGAAADLYSPARHLTRELELGELDLERGDNRVMVKLVGQNPASSGAGLDIYRLIFERVG